MGYPEESDDPPESDNFRVIRGAMNLLKEPYETIFHTIFHPMGIEKI